MTRKMIIDTDGVSDDPATADNTSHITNCWELDIPGWKSLLEQSVRQISTQQN